MVWCASNLLAGAELEIDSDAMPKGEYLRRIPKNGRIISCDHFPPLHTFPCLLPPGRTQCRIQAYFG